jgi:DNA-binding transcriptional LysR family regulator
MLARHMELRHLRYFVAVAENENVTRAALKLHVSQPGLSRQVRDLENELGFQLLERSAKSVRLTEAGRVFLTEARAVLQRADDAVQTARSIATSGGEIHVGYAPSPTARILPPALRFFHNEMARVRVKLHDLSTEDMLADLRARRLDLGLLVQPGRAMLRGVRFESLLRDPMRLAVAPTHPLARRRTVSLSDTESFPLISYTRREYPEYHEMLEKLFVRQKLKLRVAEEHDGATSVIAAVEAGTGVAIVPDSISCFSGLRLKLLPLSPAPEPVVVGAAWIEKQLSSTAERFLDSARRAAREGIAFQG